jgi:hypothetical protein
MQVIRLTEQQQRTLDILKRCPGGRLGPSMYDRYYTLESNNTSGFVLIHTDSILSLVKIDFLTVNIDMTFLITQRV